MTPPDCLFCHFNNYLLKNHWLICDMTGFDVSQLWAHYVICELELLSYPVVEIDFVAPYLLNTVTSKSQEDRDSFDNIYIHFKESINIYKVACIYANIAKFVGMSLFNSSILANSYSQAWE